MFTKHALLRCLFAATLLLLGLSLQAAPRDGQWRQVQSALKARMPKTALEDLEVIYAEALADKAYPEALKALCYKMTLESSLEEQTEEHRILRLQKALESADPAMRTPMHAILALWYWNYFQHNRWKILDRSNTQGQAGTDIQTWDASQFFAAFTQHFEAALAQPAQLQAMPIQTYGALLVEGSVSDQYRPSVYDFLANAAINAYQMADFGMVRGEDEFVPDSSSPLFGPLEDFLAWKPESKDSESLKLRAIKLYQDLLRFHLKDRNRSALYDADLNRLSFARSIFVWNAGEQPFQEALKHFVDTHRDHESGARAAAVLADLLHNADSHLEAEALARWGLATFPSTPAATLCQNVLKKITAPRVQITTETNWCAPWPTIDITYRNVDHVYFRLIPIESFEKTLTWHSRGRDKLCQLTKETPALSWNEKLPATKDYAQRIEKLPVPTALKPGFYHLIASHNDSFSAGANQLSHAIICVTKLALILEQHGGERELRGFILDAESGNPVREAKVTAWTLDSKNLPQSHKSVMTDKQGRFRVGNFSGEQMRVLVHAEKEGQEIANGDSLYFYHYPRTNKEETGVVRFFTDRSIYRPGQVLHFKAILASGDHKNARYGVVYGEEVTVVIRDNQNQVQGRQTLKTNEFGSISGTFTLPLKLNTGRMRLMIEDVPGFSLGFSVEEYKRPKFVVEFKEPVEAPKLGTKVQVPGFARAYSTASMEGARVKWSVQRSAQFPRWRMRWRDNLLKAIAHGETKTDAKGDFVVSFIAEPDANTSADENPIFNYEVKAEVIDSTGETHAESCFVRVGYAALEADLEADDWLTDKDPATLKVSTRTLDNKGCAAQGSIRIHRLVTPGSVQRPALDEYSTWRRPNRADEPKDPNQPENWELGALARELNFATDENGKGQVSVTLPPGVYQARLETKDRFGKTVQARQTLWVLAPEEKKFPTKVPSRFTCSKTSYEVGETLDALWGTGYDKGRAFVEILRDEEVLASYWTSEDSTQTRIRLPITEAERGGFFVRTTHLRENRAYFHVQFIDVPWTNKKLSASWQTFRSKLRPGQKETWTATFRLPNGRPADAEMVAALYDASLDQFIKHSWPSDLGLFRRAGQPAQQFVTNRSCLLSIWESWPQPDIQKVAWLYRTWPGVITGSGYDWDSLRASVSSGENSEMLMLQAFEVATKSNEGYMASVSSLAGARMAKAEIADAPSMVSPPPPDLPRSQPAKLSLRKNFQETAFFFPHLQTDGKGVVKMDFTMPDSLTEWHFLGFTHDQEMRSALLTGTVFTSKDLMLEPNPPRFVREGDMLEFTVKLSNTSDTPQRGEIRLHFSDAESLAPRDTALGNLNPQQAFSLAAHEARSFSWKLTIPEGLGFLSYKAIATSENFSDGEEGFLPILSRQVLVRESLPLSLRGEGTKKLAFQRLLDSAKSPSLRHQSLTVQMVSNPSWYAVLALPYLMEFPHECSEQVFSRFYANRLAAHLATSNPKIKRVFDLWTKTKAPESPLAQNPELKALMLEETPWLRDAKNETEAMRKLGELFEQNRVQDELQRCLKTLEERQSKYGLWPWFPGGQDDEYISMIIVTGFGHLRQLGVEIDLKPVILALPGLDAWMNQRYQEGIKKDGWEAAYVPSPLDALYLYCRSFFLKELAVHPDCQRSFDFYLSKARYEWPKMLGLHSQVQVALALKRFGYLDEAKALMKSFRERAIRHEELGMHWKEESSWYWYQAPIETQALLIEAFAEIDQDQSSVEDCKTWLLKQKQTQAWKSTRATADAVYALLLQGSASLDADTEVQVTLGGELIKPDKQQAGTGFYQKRFDASQVQARQGEITLSKTNEGPSWGGLHWQYLENLDKVPASEGSALKLRKTLWIRENTKKGSALRPLTGPVSVGDELVVRLELRADRAMDYVHLKDQRGSGTEPLNVLSGYRYQGNLGYYESTRDTASHFFISHLPAGTHVFEYSERVQLRGRYQTGIAEIQCMYAPEFNSHSGSLPIEVH